MLVRDGGFMVAPGLECLVAVVPKVVGRRLQPALRNGFLALLSQGAADDALGALHGGGAGHDGQGLLVGDSLRLHDLASLMPLFRTEGHEAPPS